MIYEKFQLLNPFGIEHRGEKAIEVFMPEMFPKISSDSSSRGQVDSASADLHSSHMDGQLQAHQDLSQIVQPIFAEKAKKNEPTTSLASRCWKHVTSFFAATGEKILQALQSFYKKMFGHQDAAKAKTMVPPAIHSQHRHLLEEDEGLISEDVDDLDADDLVAEEAAIDLPQQIAAPYVVPPQGIPNIGNACYRISVEQAIFACKPLLDAIVKSGKAELQKGHNETENQFRDRVATAEVAYWQFQIMMANLEDGSSSEIGEDQVEWQKIIFQGAFQSDWYSWWFGDERSSTLGTLQAEFSPNNSFRQMEADAYLLLILGTLCNPLNVSSTQQIVRASTENLANCNNQEERLRELQKASELGTLYTSTPQKIQNYFTYLDISNFPGLSLQARVNALSDPLFGETEGMRLHRQAIIKNKQGQEVVQQQEKPFDQFVEMTKQVGDPKDFLIIQPGRADKHGKALVNRTPIPVPEDGIIDFSRAYDLPEGQLQYSATSFICHHGEFADGGHYTSYVKKEGQWFHCNDHLVEAVSTEEAMNEMEQAYIMFFAKL